MIFKKPLEVGFYEKPEKVGWLGWIRVKKGIYFIRLNGEISDLY